MKLKYHIKEEDYAGRVEGNLASNIDLDKSEFSYYSTKTCCGYSLEAPRSTKHMLWVLIRSASLRRF